VVVMPEELLWIQAWTFKVRFTNFFNLSIEKPADLKSVMSGNSHAGKSVVNFSNVAGGQ
jgi:hypothetical protein